MNRNPEKLDPKRPERTGKVVAFDGKHRTRKEEVMRDKAELIMEDDLELAAEELFGRGHSKATGPRYMRFHMGRYKIFGHFVHASFLLLACVEFVVFTAAVFLAASIEGVSLVDTPVGISLPRAMLSSLMLVVSLATMGMYATHQRERIEGLLLRLVVSFGIWLLMLTPMYALFPSLQAWTGTLSTVVTICVMSSLLLRAGFVSLLEQNIAFKRVVVLGAGKQAQQIERLRRKSDRRGFDLIGYINPVSGQQPLVDQDLVVPVSHGLCRYLNDQKIDEVVMALESNQHHLISNELLNCRMSGIGIVKLVDFLEREAGKIQVDLLQPSWLLHAEGFSFNPLRAMSKRIFDIFVSLLLLVMTSPLYLVAMLAIWFESGCKGNVFYLQKRVGQNGREFNLLKLRSMRADAEKDGKARWASKNDPRITVIGSILRKYRIDEIPQLWNILIGDMSLIGPRPERPEFVQSLNLLSPFYNERHRVKPGLAGWAQLRYPYGASEEDSIEKLKFDLYYVKNNNLLLDVLILIQTLEVVVFGQGAR